MEYERNVQAAIREVIAEGLAESSHDLADGGLAVALAECSFNQGGIGAEIEVESGMRPEHLLFHEGPSRILVSTGDAARVQAIAARHGVEAPVIGLTVAGKLSIINGGMALIDSAVDTLRTDWEEALERMLRD
jgi:phosphoribosylformylglycinamidine synthase